MLYLALLLLFCLCSIESYPLSNSSFHYHNIFWRPPSSTTSSLYPRHDISTDR
jgi:hypothetical protein